MTKAVFQIDAPRERLFGIIADFDRWKEWFPSCKDAKITTDKGNTKHVELTLASLKTITLVLEFDLTPIQLINFRKISGKDVKDYVGSFRLMDASDGAGTVVVGEMEMDAGAIAPKFLVNRMMDKSLKDTADALKARVRTAPPPPKFEFEAAPAAVTAAAAPKKARRKRLVHVIQSGDGYRVWITGKTHFYKFK